jgi:hypothetical protein
MLSLRQPPAEPCEITNHKLLPFVHDVTHHLPAHSDIFALLTAQCQKYVTNKYRIHRSRTITRILEYVRSIESFAGRRSKCGARC